MIEDNDGSTYRAVYTTRFRSAVYVLHAFQKKSKRGIATPQKELEQVERRLKAAAQHHKVNYEQQGEPWPEGWPHAKAGRGDRPQPGIGLVESFGDAAEGAQHGEVVRV